MPLSEQFGYTRFESGHLQPETGSVVSEALVRLHVNGQELATLMCSPHELDVLALGFLANEGIIHGRADVRLVKVCPSLACVEVWLRDASRELPTHGVITSGCGGGITFADLTAGIEPLASELRVTPRQIGRLFGALQGGQETRGVHTAALAEGEVAVGCRRGRRPAQYGRPNSGQVPAGGNSDRGTHPADHRPDQFRDA